MRGIAFVVSQLLVFSIFFPKGLFSLAPQSLKYHIDIKNSDRSAAREAAKLEEIRSLVRKKFSKKGILKSFVKNVSFFKWMSIQVVCVFLLGAGCILLPILSIYFKLLSLSIGISVLLLIMGCFILIYLVVVLVINVSKVFHVQKDYKNLLMKDSFLRFFKKCSSLNDLQDLAELRKGAAVTILNALLKKENIFEISAIKKYWEDMLQVLYENYDDDDFFFNEFIIKKIEEVDGSHYEHISISVISYLFFISLFSIGIVLCIIGCFSSFFLGVSISLFPKTLLVFFGLVFLLCSIVFSWCVSYGRAHTRHSIRKDILFEQGIEDFKEQEEGKDFYMINFLKKMRKIIFSKCMTYFLIIGSIALFIISFYYLTSFLFLLFLMTSFFLLAIGLAFNSLIKKAKDNITYQNGLSYNIKKPALMQFISVFLNEKDGYQESDPKKREGYLSILTRFIDKRVVLKFKHLLYLVNFIIIFSLVLNILLSLLFRLIYLDSFSYFFSNVFFLINGILLIFLATLNFIIFFYKKELQKNIFDDRDREVFIRKLFLGELIRNKELEAQVKYSSYQISQKDSSLVEERISELKKMNKALKKKVYELNAQIKEREDTNDHSRDDIVYRDVQPKKFEQVVMSEVDCELWDLTYNEMFEAYKDLAELTASNVESINMMIMDLLNSYVFYAFEFNKKYKKEYKKEAKEYKHDCKNILGELFRNACEYLDLFDIYEDYAKNFNNITDTLMKIDQKMIEDGRYEESLFPEEWGYIQPESFLSKNLCLIKLEEYWDELKKKTEAEEERLLEYLIAAPKLMKELLRSYFEEEDDLAGRSEEQLNIEGKEDTKSQFFCSELKDVFRKSCMNLNAVPSVVIQDEGGFDKTLMDPSGKRHKVVRSHSHSDKVHPNGYGHEQFLKHPSKIGSFLELPPGFNSKKEFSVDNLADLIAEQSRHKQKDSHKSSSCLLGLAA
ncbi:hypothetical protein AB834_06600 [PVC group bacterium (ex Bugula neritina AB1)]|nr:hypothetical protein AB834_06600 [PVC group bacterium (ex Bugula neritina AB1)]